MNACVRCNDLKGPLTLAEFRRALSVRLGHPVVFTGEATTDRPATAISSVRTLEAARNVVRLDPVVAERLNRAVLFLRATRNPRLQQKTAASEAIERWCDEIATRDLAGADFPPNGGLVSLFDDDDLAEPVLRPGELSSTPRVPLSRDMTRISGPVLDEARRAVFVLRQQEDPNLTLVRFIDTAVTRLVGDVTRRYPDTWAAAAAAGELSDDEPEALTSGGRSGG